MTTITYNVPGIHCNHCIHTINMELADLAGVQTVKADLDSKTVRVEYNAPATEQKIEETLAEINYPVQK